MKENTLWAEMYRPQVMSDVILPSRINKVLDGYISKNDIPNMIFSGPAGCCKTTTAKAIARTLGSDYLFVNASDETGKAGILDIVVPFATSVSMDSSAPKIIILDESDRLTPAAQDSLKSWMETVSETTRFIWTVNSPSKIINPIKSRCTTFDFNIKIKEKPELMMSFMNRITSILQENNIPFDKKAVMQLIVQNFPDYRKVINSLQIAANGYGEINENVFVGVDASIASELIPIIKNKNFEELRKWILETEYSHDDIFESLYTESHKQFDNKIVPSIIVILADYSYKSSFCLNQQLNVLACCVEIMSNI